MGHHCHVCKIEPEKPLRCSQCQKTIYCSVACQKADWKKHKRSTCTKAPMLHKLDKMMKKMSGPGSVMNSIQRIEDAAWAERRRNPGPVSACDGCFRTFSGMPVDPNDQDAADMLEEELEDAGDPFKRCNECDWTICKDCDHIENQGIPFFDRPPGTCRCPTSNFGVNYCLTDPFYFHGDGRKQYTGDRHPDIAESRYNEDAFEQQERPCRNCGVIARCLKKEYLKDTGLAKAPEGSSRAIEA